MNRPLVAMGMTVLLMTAGLLLPGKLRAAGMTEEEFVAFADAAVAELEVKQDKLIEEYAMGTFARWQFDQETALLQFFDKNDRLALEADVIDIGSYAPKSITWKWAWSNETVVPSLRKKAEKLKELEGITDFEMFGLDEAFEVEDENMAWTLVAIAVKHLGALGCYRAPSSNGGPHSYLAISGIRKVPAPAPSE